MQNVGSRSRLVADYSISADRYSQFATTTTNGDSAKPVPVIASLNLPIQIGADGWYTFQHPDGSNTVRSDGLQSHRHGGALRLLSLFTSPDVVPRPTHDGWAIEGSTGLAVASPDYQ